MSAIDEVLEQARAKYVRVTPAEAVRLVTEENALLVDTRPGDQRREQGGVPGAVVIDRTVLEWRLDPSCAHRIPEAADLDRPVVILCAEGYSSSLAVASLSALGLTRVTDVIGGFYAWRAQGCPVTEPAGSNAPQQ